MSENTYEIRSTEVKSFTYKTPIIMQDEAGLHAYTSEKKTFIKKIIFLNEVCRDKSGKILSYKPLYHVNRFLIDHHVTDGKQESEQYSKALINYFSFIIALQKSWDKNKRNRDFENENQRPRWDLMNKRKSQRLTYMYREALKASALDQSQEKIARTTATAYMNAVVKFYKYHIRLGHEFGNPPFEYEEFKIHFIAPFSSMKPNLSKVIHSSDLRLNFPTSQKNDGGYLPTAERSLSPLTNIEWYEIEKILTETKTVLKNVNGANVLGKLAEEYCLFFLVSRFTGLRREEVASLHCGQIKKVEEDKKFTYLGVGDTYGSMTKTKDGGNKSRKTIIPTTLMNTLHSYTKSKRYQNRLEKFKQLCVRKRKEEDKAFFEVNDGVDENKNYLFISNNGTPIFLNLAVLNSRWSEIRNTVNFNLSVKNNHTIHNLRPTFAINIFRVLLKNMKSDRALAFVSGLLGHSELNTTLKYLKIAENNPSGDDIYEDVLDYLGFFEEDENTII